MSGCCTVAGHTCCHKDVEWAACRESCTPHHPSHLTPWTCNTIIRHHSGKTFIRRFQSNHADPTVAGSDVPAASLSTTHLGVAVAVAVVPLLLLLRQAAKRWRREGDGWTAVANPDGNPDELALFTA